MTYAFGAAGQSPACPNAAALNDFTCGRLSTATLEAIAEHIGNCTMCELTLGGLDPQGDPLLAAVRKSVEFESPSNVEYHRVVNLVATLFETATQLATTDAPYPSIPD